jgi:chromosome partitioning protein
MKTILVINQKGGVGKTTIADEIAFALERRGSKVCFYDLDPQGGAVHVPGMVYDDTEYQVVDTPPVLTTEFQNMCRKADIIIMPTTASMMDLPALQRCYDLAQKSETKAHIGLVVNNYDERRKIDKDFITFLHNASMPIWATIPTTTVIRQAQALRQSVVDYKKTHPVSEVFEKLIEKISEELK